MIENNDGFNIKAKKPADIKMFVGDGQYMEYSSKEDIPEYYRFKGMVVFEMKNDVYKIYRLENGISNSDFTDISDICKCSADEILSRLKTVDGTGSGLDADKLDGKQSGEFAYNDLSNVGTLPNDVKIQLKGDKGDQGATGPQGVQGIQGPKGDQGMQGAQGLKGDKGDDGVDGSGVTILGSDTIVNIKAKSGTPGDMWISTDTGTDSAGTPVAIGDGIVYEGTQWLTVGPIRGPKGDKGDKGDIGNTGAKGDQGVQGIQGVEGPQGIQGIQGPKGDQGIQGVQGLKGDKGDKGDTGAQGPAGSPDTGEDILSKLSTVDGAGSGLDSDLLQGKTPNELPISNATQTELDFKAPLYNPTFTGTVRLSGDIVVIGLPTSDPHVEGALWADGHILAISAG